MRRKIAIGAIMCCIVIGAAQATPFTDIDTSAYRDSIAYLQELKIVNGYADGSFRPQSRINRAEFLKILMDVRYPTTQVTDLRCFKDLDVRVPQWYAQPVCAGRQLGIVQGYPDGNFRPDRQVNLVEALKMVFRTFGIHTGGSATPWYQPLIAIARTNRILLPLLAYPDHALTRGEMASLVTAVMAPNKIITETNGTTVNLGFCGNAVREGFEECDAGTMNGQPGSGCSTLCLSLVDTPMRGLLTIEQRTTNVTPVIAAGQINLPLLAFTAVAGRQDVRLTSVTFAADVGSLTYGRNYRLLMNRTGRGYDEVAQANGSVDSTRLTFRNLLNGNGVIIPEGIAVPFIVEADLPSTLGPVTLRLRFATDVPDYVEAEGAVDGLQLEGVGTDGICTAPNCFISVITIPASTMTINTAGTLSVTADSLTAPTHLLMGGSVTPELLRLRFRAEGESVEVRSLGIDGVPDTIDALRFYALRPGQSLNQNRDTPFARATTSQCPMTIPTRACANLGVSSLTITPDTETVIAVAAELKDDHSGGRSGETITLSLSNAIDSGHAIDAVGASSKRSLLQNDGLSPTDGKILIGTTQAGSNNLITGNAHRMTFANISAIDRSGTVSDYVPAGNAVIGAFKISATPSTNRSKDVLLKTITFQVTAQNVLLDPAGYSLATQDNPSIGTPCAASATSGAIQVTCSGLETGSINYRIPQGEDVTYQLSGNIVNPQVTDGMTSVVETSLSPLGQPTITNTILWSDGTTDFSWVDVPVTSVQGTEMRSR